MQLELYTGHVVDSPDELVLTALLREHANAGDFYAILSSDDETYMQTAANGPNAFVLEYRDGSSDRHYECTNESLDLENVVAAMVSYLRDDAPWRMEFSWRSVDLSRGRNWAAVAVVAMIAGALLLIMRAIRSTG